MEINYIEQAQPVTNQSTTSVSIGEDIDTKIGGLEVIHRVQSVIAQSVTEVNHCKEILGHNNPEKSKHSMIFVGDFARQIVANWNIV